MIDFYEEIPGLNREMSLAEIQDELLRQEKVWIKRQVYSPEKATKMRAVLIDANKAFATEASRQEYERALEESRKQPEAVDPNAEALLQYRKWLDKALSLLHETKEPDLAHQAFEKALSFHTPSTPEEVKDLLIGVDICGSLEQWTEILGYANQALLLDSGNLTFHKIKADMLLMLAMLEANESNGQKLGTDNSYYTQAQDAILSAMEYASRAGDQKTQGLLSADFAKLIFFAGVPTPENQETAVKLAHSAQEKGAGDQVQEVLNTAAAIAKDEQERKDYLNELDRNTEKFRRDHKKKQKNSGLGLVVFVCSVVLGYLTAGSWLGTLVAGAGIAFFCWMSAGKNGPVVVSAIWALAFSFLNSTKMYTALGYGAASADIVMTRFKVNLVLLIAVAIIARIAGKIKS